MDPLQNRRVVTSNHLDHPVTISSLFQLAEKILFYFSSFPSLLSHPMSKRKRTDKPMDEFEDDETSPLEAVAPDGSIIKLPQVGWSPPPSCFLLCRTLY